MLLLAYEKSIEAWELAKDEVLWYIDYECNEYMEQWNFENWGIKYWSKTKDFREYGSKR